MGQSTRNRKVTFVTEFADQSEDSLVIPEDLSTLSVEEVQDLHTRATEAFNAIYQGGGADLSEADLETLSSLAEGLTALSAEVERHAAAADERRTAAEALATKVGVTLAEDGEENETPEDDEEGEDEDGEDSEDGEDPQPESVTASAQRREVRVNLAGLRGRAAAPAAADEGAQGISQFARSSSDSFGVGKAVDWQGMADILTHRLRGYSQTRYETAAARGQALRETFGVATIAKPYGEFVANTPEDFERVADLATDQTRLKGNSLLASGSWCAPTEVIYDIYDCGEEASGLLDLPTISAPRGSISFNRGVDFGELLSDSGFHYTRAEDEAGDYDGDGGGSKPCFKVPCVDFVSANLELDGLCIQAGLMQAKVYPELLRDTIRKALIAHEIRMDSRRIATIAAGSTAVTMPTVQVGATAPILTAVELQIQHYRAVGSLSDSTVLEVVLPTWVRGAIRADLSRRLGVDLISVTDARIDEWFRNLGAVTHWVKNWQSIATTAASAFTSYPTTVDILIYKAGTWVAANSEVISLENVFDSTLLGTNDFTALFTEEATMTVRRGCDSRKVTVQVNPTGATHGGVAITRTGTVPPA